MNFTRNEQEDVHFLGDQCQHACASVIFSTAFKLTATKYIIKLDRDIISILKLMW